MSAKIFFPTSATLSVPVKHLSDVRIVGPAPSGIEKLRGKYRWEIELLAKDIASILRYVRVNRDVIVDVDPVSS